MKVLIFWAVFGFGLIGSMVWLDSAVIAGVDQMNHNIDHISSVVVNGGRV